MSKTALVIIAEASEEMETVTPIDTLRRAGVEVTVAGLNGTGPITLSRKVLILAEKSLKEALSYGPYDAIIFPGGLIGSKEFVNSEAIGALLRNQEANGGVIAGICAAPTAFHKNDICTGRNITSHPLVQSQMEEGSKYTYKEDRVVIDGNLITSRGPGTALEWSLAIVGALLGQEAAENLGKWMMLK